MKTIGRNDPCPCGSGKKYKNCCLSKSEEINIAKYKYNKYLEIRSSACIKAYKLGIEELNINKLDPGFYLLDFLLFEPEESKNLRNADDFDNFIKNASFHFTIFGYPIFEADRFEEDAIIADNLDNNYKDKNKNKNKYKSSTDKSTLDEDSEIIDSFGFKLNVKDLLGNANKTDANKTSTDYKIIEDNYLWKYCLVNFPNKFSEEEKKFLNSIKESIPGFFKVIDVDISTGEKEILGCPITLIEDIFTKNRYKLLDRLLSEYVVKHDIFCGILLPYTQNLNDTYYVLEGTPSVIFQPLHVETLLELIKSYSAIYKKIYKFLFSKKTNYPEIFKAFPMVLYLVAVDYFYHLISAPLPKLVNYDKEEIIFSKTTYKINNRDEIKNLIIKLKNIEIVEDTEKEAVLHWLNEKDTILGTIFIYNNKLIFETNSRERLERWKKKIKNLPMDFVKTSYTNPEKLIEKYSKDNEKDKTKAKKSKKIKEEKVEIPQEALEEFALKWWENYYNEWLNTKIPALGNITPLEAIKTKEGRKKVENLIEDYENRYLHDLKNMEKEANITRDADIQIGGDLSSGAYLQKYFNPDELRKRLGLI